MLNGVIFFLFILIFPLLSSVIGFAIGIKNEKLRDIFNVIMTGIIFSGVIFAYSLIKEHSIELFIPDIMGIGLNLKLDMFRYIFVFISSLVWFLTTIYSTQYLVSYKRRNRYYLFFMLTMWSTLGIFISENLLNLFTFFEIMSLTSYVLIVHDEDEYSHEAGNTYIIMAVTGGIILLMGLILLYAYTNTLDIEGLKAIISQLGSEKYFIMALIIIGFGVKAGMIPFHIWLPKAHPAAPAPASAVLSGILLKTGIYGIIMILIIMKFDIYVSYTLFIMGLINMLIGGILAVYQRNIKRILAYSSMSQIGYILMGIGLMGILGDEKAIAVYGIIYHIFNHAIYKVLLFLSVGVIYMALHELSINKIGGYGRNKNLLKIIFFIGLSAIIGLPGVNGFVSKTLLHHALTEASHIHHHLIFSLAEFIFIISSSLTVAYLLKLFVAIFIEDNEFEIVKVKANITKRALFPIAILALICIYFGVRPNEFSHLFGKAILYFNLQEIHEIEFYTWDNIFSSIIIIIIGVIGYFYGVRKFLKKGEKNHWWYVNPSLNWFSIERNIYKPVYKIVFQISYTILKVIDEGIIITVTFINSIITGKSRKDFKISFKAAHDLQEYLDGFYVKLNSITYSIFIFGAVLFVCLTVLLLT